MSFGSKYLFFADRHRNALILDRLVREWLAANSQLRLKLSRDVPSYALWLDAAYRWALELDITPEEVELFVFNDQLPEDSQWRSTSQ